MLSYTCCKTRDVGHEWRQGEISTATEVPILECKRKSLNDTWHGILPKPICVRRRRSWCRNADARRIFYEHPPNRPRRWNRPVNAHTNKLHGGPVFVDLKVIQRKDSTRCWGKVKRQGFSIWYHRWRRPMKQQLWRALGSRTSIGRTKILSVFLNQGGLLPCYSNTIKARRRVRVQPYVPIRDVCTCKPPPEPRKCVICATCA